MSKEPINYPPMFHAEAIMWLENKWNGYRLTPHERNIAVEIFNYARTKGEELDIHMFEDLGYITKQSYL